MVYRVIHSNSYFWHSLFHHECKIPSKLVLSFPNSPKPSPLQVEKIYLMFCELLLANKNLNNGAM